MLFLDDGCGSVCSPLKTKKFLFIADLGLEIKMGIFCSLCEPKMTDDMCDLCVGSGVFLSNPCVFCNGTGEWNSAAQGYIKNHICQCIILDRKFCPVCHKPCHHDTTLNPKQKIDPGHGGMSSHESYPKEEIVAV